MLEKGKSKMLCVPCKTEMNHHAEKLVDPRTPEESKQMDAALGGVVHEMHTCPACGGVKSRIALE